MDEPQAGPSPVCLTCDGEEVLVDDARDLSRKHEYSFFVAWEKEKGDAAAAADDDDCFFGGDIVFCFCFSSSSSSRRPLTSLFLSSFLSSFKNPTLFLAGFALLPWAWALNAWIFYPVAFGPSQTASDAADQSSSSPDADAVVVVADPVVRRNARASALLAAASGVALLSWAAAFSLGGARVVGRETFDRLNLGDLDLDAYGLRS